jgi:hypothetical protein
MPYLIASTPRAGIWNHRLLVANDFQHEILDLYDLVKTAREKPQGKAWISVSRLVKQFDSEREGKEILILGDIDVHQLKTEQIKNIEHRLQKHLEDDLNELVTRDIDWKRDGKDDPIIRKELSAWILGFSEMDLPPSNNKNWSIKLKEKHKANKPKKKLASYFMDPSAIAGFLFVLGTISGTTYYFKEDLFKGEPESKSLSFLNEDICEYIGAKECKISAEKYNDICNIFSLPQSECDEVLEEIAKDSPLVFKEFSETYIKYKNDKFDLFNLNAIVSEEIKMEIAGSKDGTFHITAKEFGEILKYKLKVKKAAESFLAYSKEVRNEANLNDLERKQKDDYDKIFAKLKGFLRDYKNIIANNKLEKLEISSLKDKNKEILDFFEACRKSETISEKINSGCNKNNKGWESLEKELSNTEIEKYIKFKAVYESIMDLEPPKIDALTKIKT